MPRKFRFKSASAKGVYFPIHLTMTFVSREGAEPRAWVPIDPLQPFSSWGTTMRLFVGQQEVAVG